MFNALKSSREENLLEAPSYGNYTIRTLASGVNEMAKYLEICAGHYWGRLQVEGVVTRHHRALDKGPSTFAWSPIPELEDTNQINDSFLNALTLPVEAPHRLAPALEVLDCEAGEDFSDGAVLRFIKTKQLRPDIANLKRISIAFPRAREINIYEDKEVHRYIEDGLDLNLRYPMAEGILAAPSISLEMLYSETTTIWRCILVLYFFSGMQVYNNSSAGLGGRDANGLTRVKTEYPKRGGRCKLNLGAQPSRPRYMNDDKRNETSAISTFSHFVIMTSEENGIPSIAIISDEGDVSTLYDGWPTLSIRGKFGTKRLRRHIAPGPQAWGTRQDRGRLNLMVFELLDAVTTYHRNDLEAA
ncbi:hypothetical protein M413DRAFT_14872 [Hebeloma cylindrosporum]|uniref:Uncharacterized protein n=1 Tax=Hebeloma cylindrosporum TaxID=76867 RepID=A0A0C3BU02_HEBCY|nr:hypothetical protein M413DRAFT_14872 [Hebeloma cylindrosporum h7]